MDRVIIDVRLNEYTSREKNPHIPFSPEEIGTAAGACVDAGASVIHYHAREPESGAISADPAAYAAAAREIRRHGDGVVLPTLGASMVTDLDARAGHLAVMAADPETRAELAPIDLDSTSLAFFDRASGTFPAEDLLYRNPVGTLKTLVQRIRAAGARPMPVAWSVGSLRLLEAFLEAGVLDEPVYLELTLSEGGLLSGHPGTQRGLEAFLDFLPPGRRIEWGALCFGGSLLPLVGAILDRGGHLALGLGDYPYPELGTPTNADLVEAVVQMARERGREPASPADVRTALALPA